MGRLFMGLVLAGTLLAVTGPQQHATGQPTAEVVVQRAMAPDACGPKTKKPNGKLWRCTFADDFEGSKLSKFWIQHPEKTPLGPGGGCKKRKNVKVWNGQLQLSVNRTGNSFGCLYHVGQVTTYHQFSQKYGRFQARIKSRGTKARGCRRRSGSGPTTATTR